MAAGANLEMALVAIIDQRVEIRGSFDPNIAAFAAIAAIGAAKFNEFFAPKGYGATAAIAAFYKYLGFI